MDLQGNGGNFKSIWRNDLKKLFQEIISGSLRQLPAEVTAENAPEGDAEEHFKAIVKTFEIASMVKKTQNENLRLLPAVVTAEKSRFADFYQWPQGAGMNF